MPDGINPNLSSPDFVNDPIIADAKFTVAFKAPPERLSISDRIDKKPCLNSFFDSILEIPIDGRQIDEWNIRMIKEMIGHFLVQFFPNIFVL